MTTEQPFEATKEGYLVFSVPGVPYSSVRAPISGMLDVDNTWVEHAMLIATLASKAYAESFPAPTGQISAETPGAQVGGPQQPQGTRQGGQGETRADKYPLLDGWSCDRCGGPVGRRPAVGRMRSDAAVCLGRCKDGQYVHSVGWLDE